MGQGGGQPKNWAGPRSTTGAGSRAASNRKFGSSEPGKAAEKPWLPVGVRGIPPRANVEISVMRRSQFQSAVLLTLPLLLGLGACSALPSFNKKPGQGLAQVDDLLTRVEQVQIEAVLSRDRSRGAFDALMAIVGPQFDGDAVSAHATLVKTVKESTLQAQRLDKSLPPLKKTAAEVFEEWTRSLESFGNTKLRAHSQSRMEETRARCEELVTATVAAQIAYDAFNLDLNDHALFLEHDFNSAAVSAIADQMDQFNYQAAELDKRLEACVNAAKRYIQSSALRGQIEAEADDVNQASLPAQRSAVVQR